MIEMAIALVLLMAFLFLLLFAGVVAVLIWSAVEMRRNRRAELAEYEARKKGSSDG